MYRFLMKTQNLILAVLAASAAMASAAVSAPFSTNFDDATVGVGAPPNFTEPTNPALSSIIEPGSDGNRKYQLAVDNTSAVGIVEVTGLSTAAGQGFSVNTQFSFTSVTGQFASTGIVFLSNSTFGTNYRVVYNLGSDGNGLLQFASGTATYASNENGTLAGSTDPLAGVFTLTLTGIYNATGAIDLTATISNSLSANTATATAVTTSTPSTNTYFGFRSAATGTGNPAVTAIYENLTISQIPEPTTASLTAIAALGLLRRKRR